MKAAGALGKLAFRAFLRRRGIFVSLAEVHPCDCGDVNCKGWRIVRAVEPVLVSATVAPAAAEAPC